MSTCQRPSSDTAIHERPRDEPLHRCLGGPRPRRGHTARRAGHLRPLVHRRHRGSPPWRGRAPSTTSSASPRRSSSSSTRPRLPALAEEVATAAAPDWVGRGTTTAGASTTGRGRWLIPTCSPTRTFRWCSSPSTPPTPRSTTSARAQARSPPRAGHLHRGERGNVVTTCGGWDFSLEGRGYDWARAVRRGGHRRHDLGPFVARLARRPPRLCAAVPTPTTTCPPPTWPGSPGCR